MTGKTSNIRRAVLGSRRQSRPPKVTWDTFCPAPKQSKTVQPGKPRSRSWAWMPQRKSARRFGAGPPRGLVDGEVRRGREGQGDTAQPEAVSAVGPQIGPAGVGGRGFGLLGHRA